MRNLKKQQVQGKNPLWHMYRFVKGMKMFKQTLIIEVCRYLPNVKLKHWAYRKLLKCIYYRPCENWGSYLDWCKCDHPTRRYHW